MYIIKSYFIHFYTFSLIFFFFILLVALCKIKWKYILTRSWPNVTYRKYVNMYVLFRQTYIEHGWHSRCHYIYKSFLGMWVCFNKLYYIFMVSNIGYQNRSLRLSIFELLSPNRVVVKIFNLFIFFIDLFTNHLKLSTGGERIAIKLLLLFGFYWLVKRWIHNIQLYNNIILYYKSIL